MDERFEERSRSRKLWFGLGTLALILLCLAACGASALLFGAVHPAGGHGAFGGEQPLALWRDAGWGVLGLVAMGIGLALKLLFLGLLLLLLIHLLKRFFWGHLPRGPHFFGRPGRGTEDDADARKGQGHHNWQRHGRYWGPPPWWESPSTSVPGSVAEEREPNEPGDFSQSDAGDPDVAPA